MRARGWRWRTPCASPTLRFHVFISVPYYTFFIYFTLFVSAPRLVALRVQVAPCIFPFDASSGVYPFLLLPCPFLLLPPRAAGVSVGSGSGAARPLSPSLVPPSASVAPQPRRAGLRPIPSGPVFRRGPSREHRRGVATAGCASASSPGAPRALRPPGARR